VNWIGCRDPERSPASADRETWAAYGIPKKIQEGLAAIRTDLDSFCDQEAYALMLSGYRMTSHEFPRCIEGFANNAMPASWRFGDLEPAVIEKAEPYHRDFHRILNVARYISFKIWRLAPGILAALLLLLGLAAAVGWLILRENRTLAGWLPPAGVAVAFLVLYFLARVLIESRASVRSPIPELLGFLLWVSTLLILVEVLWYARLLWLWGTGFSVGTGLASWILAGASAAAGLVVLLTILFLFAFLLTLILRSRKSWSEVAIALGFLFFLPLANLHLLTYDRWYLWWGRLQRDKIAAAKRRSSL
jgi:hypothetical protein